MEQQKNTPEWLAAQEVFQQYCLEPEQVDQQEWETWFHQRDISEQTKGEAEKLVLQLSLKPNAAETEAEFQRFRQTLKGSKNTAGKSRNIRRILLRLAAAIAILCTAYWVWDETQIPPTLTASTTFGETRRLELIDGSIVTLNANSQLRYVADWSSEEEREIWLDGEAYFEVSHQKDRPFVVHTTRGDITVLGTSFNVADRPEQFDVTLVEGSVQFELGSRKIIKLSPNEQVGIYQDTLYHRKIDVEATTAWRFDRMVFKNVPISTIVKQLEEEFNLIVKVSNQAVLNRKVKATIPKNDPVLLLEALSVLYDLDIKKLNERAYLID